MGATAPASNVYTVPDYLQKEIETGHKFEFYNGKIVQMSGGTIENNRIARNVLAELHFSLQPVYEAFGGDQKIYLPKYNFYVYPDAVVVTGSPIKSDEEANAIVNPLLIIEVLSNSTGRYDRGDKFIQYQSLPSFKEYALIRQDLPEVQTVFREEEDLWRSKEFSGLDSSLHFRSINLSIPMTNVYKNVSFEE